MHTFDGEATVPSTAAKAMIIEVTRHVYRTLLRVVAGLAIPC
jgi:hypothetical protein